MEQKPKKQIGKNWTPATREAYEKEKARLQATGKPMPKGWAAKFNSPINNWIGDSEEDRAVIKRLLGETRLAYKMPGVKSDAELEERLDNYFERCVEYGIIPTVEEMCLYIGYTRNWVSEIRIGKKPGFSPDTKRLLNAAMEFMATIDAKMVMTGKVRDAVYIFRGKNYHGMKDQQDVTISTDGGEKDMSKEELEDWFLEDGKKIVQEFPEDQE